MRTSLFALLAMAAAVSAQEYRGTFSGTITDSQGSAVPKAKIVATETRTGTRSEAYSENTGNYTIPFLTPGQYEISAEAPGFKKYTRQGITLSVGEHPVIDIRLDVGVLTESVTVTADAPMLAESNASVGQIITTSEVDNFPVNGRTPMMLAHMAFGVLSTFEPGPVRPFDNGSGNALSVAGSKSGSNEVLLNGSPNSGFSRQMAYSPAQDAVQEVRVSVFDADAAYGHSGGGTVNMVTKSGTNSLHAWLSEYNQNSLMNANGFYMNNRGTARAPYHYNQYGATASGPVYVPKVFDGRNKVFWLFSWEGLRDSTPSNSPIETGSPVNFATVPTDAERQGDFSALLKANKAGTDYTIYDPATGVMSGTKVSRQPFPNNAIPASRLNKLSLNLLKYFPAPNNPNPNIDGYKNYLVGAINTDGYDNELGQLDVNLGDKHKLVFNARHNYRVQNKNDYFHDAATGLFLYRVNQGASLEDTYTIGAGTVANVRGSWARYMENRGWPSDGIDLTALGFPSYIAGNSPGLKFPRLVFTNSTITSGAMTSFQQLGTDDNGGSIIYDNFQLFASVVKIHGGHTVKVGTDLRQVRYSNYTQGYSSGYYTFNSNWTNNPAVSTTGSPLGQDLAAFLLGLPSSGQFDLNAQSTSQSSYYAFFVQDDWRARRNLTLNLGLRFEHDTAGFERFNRAVNGFDPTAASSITAPATAAFQAALAANAAKAPMLSQVQFNPVGGFTFPTAGNGLLYHPQSYIFSPRFGFAWTPSALHGTTVVRGGFAVFATPVELAGNGIGGSPTITQAGFSQTTQFTATNDSYLTPAATFSNPFPSGFVPPSGSANGAATSVGQSITYYDPEPRDAIMLRWNLGIQRTLPGQMVMEVAYIGQHSVRLPINTQLDFLPRQYLSTSPVRDVGTITLLTNNAVTNPFKGLIPTGGSLNGSTVQPQQLLLPYPQFTGVTLNGNPAGSAYYHSLAARLQKRFSNGLTFMYNFMYSKLIARTNYLNPSDFAPEKRVGDDNRPLRNVLAGSYELPVGRGKRIRFNSRLANAVVGGWSLNGMLTLQSGSQLGWGNYTYLGGPLNLDPHQPNGLAFDTTQFVTGSANQLGSNIQTFDTQFSNLRRDMVKNLDMSASKKFEFSESKYFQLRFEAFNATNRVTFGNPNTNPTSSAFGQIATQVNTPRRIQVAGRLVW